MKYILLFFSVIIFTKGIGQNTHDVYDWNNNPRLSVLSTEESQLSAVIIKDHRIIEYDIERFNGTSKEYYTKHVLTKVNDDRGIEQHNKVYIPMNTGAKIIAIKVRTVDLGGNITMLNKSNIKELKNVDGYRNYKIFAIEGLVKGGDVEYMYTIEKPIRSFGREVIQSNTKIKIGSITIASNRDVSVDVRSYNGFPELDEVEEGNVWLNTATAYDIPGVVSEEYSAENASRMRVDYKIDHVFTGQPINTWSIVANQIVSSIISTKGKAKVYGMVKKLQLQKLTDEEKVKSIETYIKENISLKNGGNQEYADLKSIVANKVANDLGLMKLFAACWEYLNVNPSIVMTSNRFNSKFDPDFASFLNINELLFYFPESKKYLVPSGMAYRLGPAPTELANNFGLEIKLKYYHEQFRIVNYNPRKYISLLDFTENKVGLHANVSLSTSMDKVKVVKTNTYQGYRAIFMRSGYSQSNANEKDEMLKQVLLSGIDDATNVDFSVENIELNNNYDNTPMRVNTSFESNAMMEAAGTDYILSIGKVIGKQSELYQESERQFDVENSHPIVFNHRIVFEIPSGYECQGLENIVIQKTISDDAGEKIAYFDSKYSMEPNKLIILIEEAYVNVDAPKAKYEEFRNVINAASNFSKVSILLSKKTE
jgi:hypothetical protein